MADDRKRSNAMTVRLTDRELLDVGKLAMREEMALAEYVHFILRRSLYGSMGLLEADGNTRPGPREHRNEE